MNVTVKPKKLSGVIGAISSKSDAHRKIICASLCEEPVKIFIKGFSKDIEATMRCVSALGANVLRNSDSVVIKMGKSPENPELFCGESGSTARFLLPVAACLSDGFTMTGEGRLPTRPFTDLVRQMAEHGCRFSSESLPMSVSGRLTGGEFSIHGNISSQYISGLLMALPTCSEDSKITLLSPLQSGAYVDMTIDTLRLFGIEIKLTDTGYFIPGNQKFKSPKSTICDGDWSNAAFFLASCECGCDVRVLGLDTASTQGDKAFLSAAKEDTVDVSEIPDLVPPLAVVAASKRGVTVFKNAGRLRLKESDRLVSVSDMINSLGGKAEILGDSLKITGNGRLSGGVVNSYSDHRIIMASAVASVISDGDIKILGAEAADKSYPSFFDDFKTLGGEIYAEY